MGLCPQSEPLLLLPKPGPARNGSMLRSALPPRPRSFLLLALCPCFFPFPKATAPAQASRELLLRPAAQHPSTSSGSEASLRPVPSGCMLWPCRATWPLSSVPPLTQHRPALGPLLPPYSTPQPLKCGCHHHPQHRPGQAGTSDPQCADASSRALLATCSPTAPGAPALSKGQTRSVCVGDR